MSSRMIRSALVWLGLSQPDGAPAHHDHDHSHGHDHGQRGGHGHTHGVVDPTIATTARGIWAIKWSFAILGVTAALQLAVVFVSGSVALLADTIHNVGDASTAVPLWVAFRLVRRKPTARFTYGLGRVEDLAGFLIVGIILFSAIVAGWEAVGRLIHPQPIALLWAVAVAGVIGFLGNEVVAVLRIRTGRQIDSAALIADGYHARADGFTSLAVVAGATGVWIGFPLADPIVGLLITAAIFAIVWQSAKAVFTRLLDGVEPGAINDIRHAAEHVAAVSRILTVRARWLGHRLTAELDVAIDGNATVHEASVVSAAVERALFGHIPALSIAHVRVRPEDATDHRDAAHGHRHAPEPASITGELAEGVLEIVDTPKGERLRFTATRLVDGAEVEVLIDRPGGQIETLPLRRSGADASSSLMSEIAPAEPHEFSARLRLRAGGREETAPFRLVEPVDHVH
jgi:cation diffusion facilitator family transporter